MQKRSSTADSGLFALDSENTWREDSRLQFLDRSTLQYPLLRVPLHCARSMSISPSEPSPEISNRPRGSPDPALLAQTAFARFKH